MKTGTCQWKLLTARLHGTYPCGKMGMQQQRKWERIHDLDIFVRAILDERFAKKERNIHITMSNAAVWPTLLHSSSCVCLLRIHDAVQE